MRSSFAIASLFAAAFAKRCNIGCIATMSVDEETCTCVPIMWMECHPQYNLNCNQSYYDLNAGRDPYQNPYKNDAWYFESLSNPSMVSL